MNCLGLGTLLWVKLELVVRLRVPERRDSIFTRVTQGFDWAMGTGPYGLPFSCCFFPLCWGLDQVGNDGRGPDTWKRQICH